MAAQLEAAMRLRLEDLLSAPLRKIEEMLERIGAIGKQLNLDKFTSAAAPMAELSRTASGVAEGFAAIGEQASVATPEVDALTEGLGGVASQAAPLADAADAIGRVSAAADVGAAASDRMAAALARAAAAAAGMNSDGVLAVGHGGEVGMTDDVAVFQAAALARQRAAQADEQAAGARYDADYGAARRENWRRDVGAGAQHVLSHGSDPLMSALELGGLFEATKKYAEFEDILRRTAITEHLDQSQVAPEEARLTKLFDTDALKTGQRSESVADAYEELVAMGIPKNIVDQAIGVHSMAATAYGVTTKELGPVVGALIKSMGIKGEDDIAGAIASVGYATQSGRFKMSDFALEFSGVAASLAAMGMRGRAGVDEGAAALETVMNNSSNPSQAAARFNDALRYMFQNKEDRSFNKLLGVDLGKYLEKAEKAGVNPLDAELRLLHARLKGLTPVQSQNYLAKLFTNADSGAAMWALLDHHDEFKQLRAADAGRTKANLLKDFSIETQGPQFQLNLLAETFAQITRTVGQAFVPAIKLANVALGGINTALTWANTNWPKTTQWVIGLSVGFLALAAALGMIGFVAGPVAAGFGMITAVGSGLAAVVTAITWPIALAVAAVALLGFAGYELWANWKPVLAWFEGMWAGVQTAFDAFGAWLEKWIAGPVGVVLTRLGSLVRGVFAGGAMAAIAAGPAGAATAGTTAGAVPPSATTVQLNHQVSVHVTTDNPATTATATVRTTRASTPIAAPNRGPTLGRP
jgi:hypothetical protein